MRIDSSTVLFFLSLLAPIASQADDLVSPEGLQARCREGKVEILSADGVMIYQGGAAHLAMTDVCTTRAAKTNSVIQSAIYQGTKLSLTSSVDSDEAVALMKLDVRVPAKAGVVLPAKGLRAECRSHRVMVHTGSGVLVYSTTPYSVRANCPAAAANVQEKIETATQQGRQLSIRYSDTPARDFAVDAEVAATPKPKACGCDRVSAEVVVCGDETFVLTKSNVLQTMTKAKRPDTPRAGAEDRKDRRDAQKAE